jgi:CRISPR/Cas system CSM-associated protein Csm4 (group 5 of RAMP superfamily)
MENFKLKISLTGEQAKRPKSNFRPWTAQKLHEFIDSQNLDDTIKEELKKIVFKFPQQAYPQFRKNFQKYVMEATKKAREQTQIKEDSIEDPFE